MGSAALALAAAVALPRQGDPKSPQGIIEVIKKKKTNEKELVNVRVRIHIPRPLCIHRLHKYIDLS